MKIFMTGVCGRLGRALCHVAHEQNIQVVGLDIAPWPQQIMAQPDNVQVHLGNYSDTALVEQLLQDCDGLVHAGGYHGDFVGKVPAADFVDAHTTQVIKMLEAALRQGVRHAALCSTMEVLVGRGLGANGAAVLDEESPPRTDSPYGLSRCLMEVLGREFARQTGMSIASLRFMAFGYHDDHTQGVKLLTYTVPAHDVARAVLAAVKKDHLMGEVFNIGPASPLQGKDIKQALRDPTAVLERYYPGCLPYLEKAGQKLDSVFFWPITSIRKAQLILDWHPQYTFDIWLKEQGWTPPPEVPT